MFTLGEKVKIKEDARSYFGNYVNTDATVVNFVGDDVVEIQTYDGKKYISHNNYLQKLETPKEENFATADLSCKHENKYLNYISPNLKFYICQDCKTDLGDA